VVFFDRQTPRSVCGVDVWNVQCRRYAQTVDEREELGSYRDTESRDTNDETKRDRREERRYVWCV
jgi:hypothetical protein